MTDVLPVDADAPEPASIARAAGILRRGGLVAFPTETVYGLGAHALDVAAVRRVFSAKGRPPTDPLIVHVVSLEHVAPLVDAIPEIARQLAARFWPGPLTLIMRRSPIVPDEVTAGLDTVAVRVPAHPVARAILEAAGVPVAAPSANLFSRPSPTRAEHVLQDLRGRIDAIVDAGPTPVGVESTVLDLSGPVPVVLRPGAVTLEQLLEIDPRVQLREAAASDGQQALPAPGLLSKHYSPRAALTLYEGEPGVVLDRIRRDARAAVAAGQRVALLLGDDDDAGDTGAIVERIGSPRDLPAVAARLYAALRAVDDKDADLVLAHGFAVGGGLGVALRDRMRRAAAGRIVRVTS